MNCVKQGSLLEHTMEDVNVARSHPGIQAECSLVQTRASYQLLPVLPSEKGTGFDKWGDARKKATCSINP